jgi:hypothetical protein
VEKGVNMAGENTTLPKTKYTADDELRHAAIVKDILQ